MTTSLGGLVAASPTTMIKIQRFYSICGNIVRRGGHGGGIEFVFPWILPTSLTIINIQSKSKVSVYILSYYTVKKIAITLTFSAAYSYFIFVINTFTLMVA